jgi:predicted CopG family antitoxin
MTKYTISVEDELWEKFKQTVTKDRTINKAIVEMIEQRVRESSDLAQVATQAKQEGKLNIEEKKGQR